MRAAETQTRETSTGTAAAAAVMLFALVCLGLSATSLEIPLLGWTDPSNTMSSALLQLQDKLQLASSEYQKLQNDLQAIVDARQRLGAQQQENELVKKEFQQLTPNNTVYKLIGPVLVQQDQEDAKGNVDKRLEFIQSEVKRVEKQIEDTNAKLEKKKLEIVGIQTEIQQKTRANPAATSPAAISA